MENTMNMKKTIVLAVVLLVAFLYMKKVAIPTHERETKKEAVFAGLIPSDLKQLRVERTQPGGTSREVFELRSLGESNATPAKDKDTGGPADDANTKDADKFGRLSWELAQVPGAVLDSTAVNTMVESIRSLNVGEPIEESQLEKDFAVYGLDKPLLTVQVQQKGTEPVEVAFGKRNEYLLKRYVKVSGRRGVFLVDDGAFAALNKSGADIRSKTPIQFSDDAVNAIELSSSAGVVKVKQVATGEWKIVDPQELPAGTVLVNDLLRALKDLRAVDFIDQPNTVDNPYGLAVPAVTLSLIMKDDSKTTKVELGEAGATVGKDSQAANKVYFRVSTGNTVFKAAVDSLAKFTKGVADLRERRLLKLSADDIEKVSASGKGIPTLEIVATNTDWNVNGKRSDPNFVEQLLNDISALQAVEFPSQVPEGAFGETFLNLTITKKGEAKETIVLHVGKEVTSKSGAARWTRIGDNGEAVLISDVEAKRIVPHEEALVELPPTPQTTPTAKLDS
jgi:hypothetical protein